MNELLILAETHFIPSPFKGDTQFGTKKTRKRRQNVPVITYNTALLFPHTKKVNENTRNFKPVIISCHRPGDPFTHLLFIQIKEIIQGAD